MKAAADAPISEGEDDLQEDNEMISKIKDGENAARKDTDTITDNCNDVLVLLQAIVVKASMVAAYPLSLCTHKCAR